MRTHLEATSTLHSLVADECADAVERAAMAIAASMRSGGKLMVCGNGGSAADSQHFAAELTSRLTSDFVRPASAAIALTTDTSFSERVIPSSVTTHAQESMLPIEHVMCHAIERELFPD